MEASGASRPGGRAVPAARAAQPEAAARDWEAEARAARRRLAAPDLATVALPPERSRARGPTPREGRPVGLADLRADERSVGFPPNHPVMHSFLGVPVRVEGRAIGNLYLTDKEDGRPFSAEDEQLV